MADFEKSRLRYKIYFKSIQEAVFVDKMYFKTFARILWLGPQTLKRSFARAFGTRKILCILLQGTCRKSKCPYVRAIGTIYILQSLFPLLQPTACHRTADIRKLGLVEEEGANVYLGPIRHQLMITTEMLKTFLRSSKV